jgi:hypothetical protein
MANEQFKPGQFVVTDEGQTVQITFVTQRNGVTYVFLANGQRKRPEQLKKSS